MDDYYYAFVKNIAQNPSSGTFKGVVNLKKAINIGHYNSPELQKKNRICP